jgi:hypothetical protein
MERLLIGLLAVAGIVWKVDLGARPYVDMAMLVALAAFMFTMGVRLDDALRRWEMQPHWRKVKPVKRETLQLR